MELLNNISKRMKEDKKFSFAVYALIAVGAILLFSGFSGSFNGGDREGHANSEIKNELCGTEVEAKLERILETIDGAGEVNVMVNAAGQNGCESVCGVIVTAEGAYDVGVRLKLHGAVCTVLGLESGKVEIFEMREVENDEKE